MIIAGHYKRTGAHIFSSISRSGQSLLVLTGEECRLCEQCVCVRKRQKGSAVSGQHSLFQFFMLNPLLCLGMSCWVTQSCERERGERRDLHLFLQQLRQCKVYREIELVENRMAWCSTWAYWLPGAWVLSNRRECKCSPLRGRKESHFQWRTAAHVEVSSDEQWEPRQRELGW